MRLKVKHIEYGSVVFYSILVILLLLYSKATVSQNETKIEGKRVKKTQNIQQYTPSILLKPKQWEVKSFHNIYTQTSNFAENWKTISSSSRSTYYTGINQFLIGVGRNVNLGFDFWYKAARIDDKSSSPFKLFGFSGGMKERLALLYAGPKVKVAPFKKIRRLSMELTTLFPLENDFEGRDAKSDNPDLFLEPDRTLIIHSFYYDHKWNNKFQLFLRASQWVSIPRDSYVNNTYVETPISGFLTWFPSSKWSVYTQQEAWIKHIENAFSSLFMQSGLGVKYQLIVGHLELEGLTTKFVFGSPQEGAGYTINFGIRYLR